MVTSVIMKTKDIFYWQSIRRKTKIVDCDLDIHQCNFGCRSHFCWHGDRCDWQESNILYSCFDFLVSFFVFENLLNVTNKEVGIISSIKSAL